MDLLDIISSLAIATSAPMSAPKIDKASAFYGDLVEWFETKQCRSESAIAQDGLLRASRMGGILSHLPRLRVSPRILPSLLAATTPQSGEQATFDVGHAVHWWWQNHYLGQWGRLWGEWECCECHGSFVGLRPSACSCCCNDEFRFRESALSDPDLRYRGHPDGMIVEPGDAKPTALLEIKTASTSSWDGLREPMHEHRIQVHAYMRRTTPPVREVYYVYIDKGKQSIWRKESNGGFKATTPPRWKVFWEAFDDAFWSGVERDLREFWAIYDASGAKK